MQSSDVLGSSISARLVLGLELVGTRNSKSNQGGHPFIWNCNEVRSELQTGRERSSV